MHLLTEVSVTFSWLPRLYLSIDQPQQLVFLSSQVSDKQMINMNLATELSTHSGISSLYKVCYPTSLKKTWDSRWHDKKLNENQRPEDLESQLKSFQERR
jgi:hypothetical protein